jgi:NADH:ubiquinone reductase (non-electrogenic)
VCQAVNKCIHTLMMPMQAVNKFIRTLLMPMQVAEQQGKYLAKLLNKFAANNKGMQISSEPPFIYWHLGSMASIGQHAAVLEFGKSHNKFTLFRGFQAWVAWRSAYLTRLGSFKKRIEVAMDWTLTLLFGRDTSRW